MLDQGQGKIYYGMHFYSGVAQYDEPNQAPFKIYINEATLRKMDPSFAGRPIFVEHVDSVEQNVDQLRKEADGWVVESFFNKADGKHWVKFIITSEAADRAVKNGFRLSNAYMPRSYGPEGVWNGVQYQKEVTDGVFEHLALVRNPRYEESVIMTPEQFKKYNEENEQELKRLENSKGVNTMALKFWNRKPAEGIDENLSVTLPKSGKEKTLSQLVNEADEMMEKKKENMAEPEMKVKLHDGSYCNVGELLEKHKAMSEEHKAMKDALEEKEKESDLELKPEDVDVAGDKHNEDMDGSDMDASMENEEEKKKENEEDKEKMAADEKAKKNAADKKKKENFDALKNAHKNAANDAQFVRIDLSADQVSRGQARYGSQK